VRMLLGELFSKLIWLKWRTRRPNIMIIAHGDVDGVISAVITARSVGDNTEFYFSGPRSIHRVLSMLPSENKGRLFVVDVGINGDKLEEVEKELARLSNGGWQITWIDHHHWPNGAVEKLSKYAKVVVRPSPSAARVVYEELGGNEFEAKLVEIADDADTATYKSRLAKLYNSLTRDKEKRKYLLNLLLEGKVEDERVASWGKKKLEEENRAIERGIRSTNVERTSSGRRFAVIDLRPRGGPGSFISKKVAEVKGVDFSLVIYTCSKFSLYAGRDRGINLKKVCESHGGGGHTYACGGKIELPFLKRILCRILGRRYMPREIKELIEEIKVSL